MLSQPQMIVIGGFAGAGKSTLAKKLGNIFSIPVFEIDHLARSIKESKDFHGASREAYGIAFDLFFSFARSHLQNGCSLILDQNMGHALTWENVRQFRDSLSHGEVKIFVLDCPYELCVTRFALRTAHPNLKEVTIEDLHDHKYKWDYLNENALPDAIRIDATQAADAVLKEVLGYLKPPLSAEESRMEKDAYSQVVFEEWDTSHPRLPEFLQFLQTVAPDQLPFVIGDHYACSTSYLLVALEDGEPAGAIRFAVQPIGPEARCPVLHLNGKALTEAKIHVFAVRPASRGRRIGTRLQKWAISRARSLGCYQVASYSSYDKEANYHVKLALGFAAQPEVHGDNEQGVYFLMPLSGPPAD